MYLYFIHVVDVIELVTTGIKYGKELSNIGDVDSKGLKIKLYQKKKKRLTIILDSL